MTTNVPSPVFTPRGFVAPSEADVLAGVQADQVAAFGGNLNPALNTPQGQLAQSEAAIIGDCNAQFVNLTNQVDPAYAEGRMQDAIGRIYYMTRNPALPTVVTATCGGGTGTVIPIGAQAVDQGGNIYVCTQAGTIPSGGTIDLTFQCQTVGPIACPTGYLNAIYQAIPGWDTITNTNPGDTGRDVESRSDFEWRRRNSVAANAQGTLPSVLGAVFGVSGVIDAYATENATATQSGSAVTASISGTTLAVTAVASGVVSVGDMVVATGVTQGTIITADLTGSGGIGNYTVNITQTVSSESMVTAPGGVRLAPSSLYVAVAGGDPVQVASEIWSKKSPGCGYNGNITVNISDPGPPGYPYAAPLPTYAVQFQSPTPVACVIAVSMQNNIGVPSTAVGQVQAAVLAAFNGQDGGQRVRIGSTMFASRFYASIAALGPWAQVISIKVGIDSADLDSVMFRIDQLPTLIQSAISVGFS